MDRFPLWSKFLPKPEERNLSAEFERALQICKMAKLGCKISCEIRKVWPPSWLDRNIGILPGVIVPVFIEFTAETKHAAKSLL